MPYLKTPAWCINPVELYSIKLFCDNRKCGTTIGNGEYTITHLEEIPKGHILRVDYGSKITRHYCLTCGHRLYKKWIQERGNNLKHIPMLIKLTELIEQQKEVKNNGNNTEGSFISNWTKRFDSSNA